METLHLWTPPIFHRDMKSANLLLTEDWEVKICDMGLARFSTKETEDTMKKLCGTYSYLAPEIFGGNMFTEKADIFAIGIICWEIAVTVCNGVYQNPYLEEFKHLTADFQIAMQVAEKQLRNTIPRSCPSKFADLINECWAPEPEDRPSATEILEKLKNMQNSIIQISSKTS